MVTTSSSQTQSYPLEAKVLHKKRRHPRDVENSIRGLLEDIDCPNPEAFLNRWDLADIVAVMPAVLKMGSAKPGIHNPSGLLWRMLEARERRNASIKEEEVDHV